MLPVSFETKRLSLRLPVPSDAAALFSAYTSKSAVSRYMMWKPHETVSTTQTFIAECISAAKEGTRVPYVLSEQGGRQPIGMLEARPATYKVDLGYVLAPDFWGRGYMPEAISRLTEIALALPEVFRVQAFCDIDNRPSQRVVEKSGFSREGRHERFVVHPNLSAEPRPCFMYARCK